MAQRPATSRPPYVLIAGPSYVASRARAAMVAFCKMRSAACGYLHTCEKACIAAVSIVNVTEIYE